MLFSHSAYASLNYCVALRGNGELAPAHWGALSQLVEKYGMPKKMAGGSSASINIFLMESIAKNHLILSQPEAVRSEQQAYLIKSFSAYLDALSQEPESQALKNILHDTSWINDMKKLFASINTQQLGHLDWMRFVQASEKHIADFKQIVKPGSMYVDLLNKDFVEYVGSIQGLIERLKAIDPVAQPSVARKMRAQILFRFTEAKQSIAMFGKFDAKTDVSLFFRPGLLSFESIATFVGRMGNFYSAYNLREETQKQLADHIATCAAASKNMSYAQFVAQTDEGKKCHSEILPIIKEHFRRESLLKQYGVNSAGKRLFKDRIYEHNTDFSLPATSTVHGASYEKYLAEKQNYLNATNYSSIKSFSVDEADLKFSYWVNKSQGESIKKYFSLQDRELMFTDAKNAKFNSLGKATWLEIIRLSPAEPGLASIKTMFKQDAVSAGGWADLEPVSVLKASACENVIYVTRRGGQSLFAQSVLKRILNSEAPAWESITEYNSAKGTEERPCLIDSRNCHETKTLHSRLYNLAYPLSSFNISLKSADMVYCTNWNAYSVTKQYNELIEDAYRSPVYLTNPGLRSSAEANGWKILDERDASEQSLSEDGLPYPRYAGCIPHAW